MEPIAILGATDHQVVGRYAEVADARKALKALAPGNYHIVRYLNEGVVVRPPAPVVANEVDMGTTFIKRAPKAASTAPTA